jgi:hypothetical protein
MFFFSFLIELMWHFNRKIIFDSIFFSIIKSYYIMFGGRIFLILLYLKFLINWHFFCWTVVIPLLFSMETIVSHLPLPTQSMKCGWSTRGPEVAHMIFILHSLCPVNPVSVARAHLAELQLPWRGRFHWRWWLQLKCSNSLTLLRTWEVVSICKTYIAHAVGI